MPAVRRARRRPAVRRRARPGHARGGGRRGSACARWPTATSTTPPPSASRPSARGDRGYLRRAARGGRPHPSGSSSPRAASGALLLALAATVDPGEEVLLADPGYPCNRHFLRWCSARPPARSPSSGHGVAAHRRARVAAWCGRRHGRRARGHAVEPAGTIVPAASFAAIAATSTASAGPASSTRSTASSSTTGAADRAAHTDTPFVVSSSRRRSA